MPRIVYDVVHRVSRASGAIQAVPGKDGRASYWEGIVQAPEGIAEIYCEPTPNGGDYVVLSTVIDGREYRRALRYPPSHKLSERGMKVVARRFLREIRGRLAGRISVSATRTWHTAMYSVPEEA